MGLETFALINSNDQVVNHIVVDKEAADFEEVMVGQLAHWGCVRYVETTEEQPLIILDESPTIWTTHTEEDGFVLPVNPNDVIEPNTLEIEHFENNNGATVTINGRIYPTNSLLIKENASNRPTGYSIPNGEVEVSLSDAE
jgi:hypothetical protein